MGGRFRAQILMGAVFAAGTVWSFQLQSVRLVIPNREAQAELGSLPIFLAVPDTLCGRAAAQTLQQTHPARWNDLDTLIAACDSHPKSHGLFLTFTRTLFQGSVEKAARAGKQLLAMESPPELAYAMENNWILFQYISGMDQWVERDLRRLLKANPEQESVWKNLFSVYMARGKYVEADQLVESVLAQNKKTLWAQQYKINLIQMLGTRSDLMEYLREKASWRDSMFAIQTVYGRLLAEKGELERAERYLTRGLEGDPHNGEAWLDLADLYYRQGKTISVSKALRRAIRAGIHNPVYFRLLAGVVENQIYLNFVKKKLYEKDLQRCFFSSRGGECRDYFQEKIEREVDSNFAALQKVLENGLAQAPQVRELAQQLYGVYGALGLGEHQENLRSQLWFHFQEPHPVKLPLKAALSQPNEHRLTIPPGKIISEALLWRLQKSDHYRYSG